LEKRSGNRQIAGPRLGCNFSSG